MIPVLYPYLTYSDFQAFLGFGKSSSDTFEKEMCEKFKSKYSLTFSSGRAGLYHILKANNIQNKFILISAYTCSVVTEAIAKSGNIPVFVDINADSFNASITEAQIREYSSNLGAIVVTNLYGFTNFSELDLPKKDRKFLVILDDALSPGHVSQRPVGLYDYVIISCGVRKPFTCLGGGVVFADDEDKFKTLQDFTLKNRIPMRLCKKLKTFILSFAFFLAFKPLLYSFTSFVRRKTTLLDAFFSEKYHDIYKECPEYFEAMCDFQKRIGINQLKKFDCLLDRRRKIGNTYYKLLSPHFTWVKKYWDMEIPYSHIPFLHPDRDELEKYLLKNGIDTEKYFDYIIPELDQYNANGKFPNAKHISSQIINLPINMGLSEKTISKIVDKIRKFDANI
ncbi:MAG: DegT/DnrJ/EryC1/StrS family aminotransferase [Candidatus Methanoperedens sp.]